jgi:GTP-binding protein
LGVAEIGNDVVVFADIPGLIEGASEGSGLGHQFLRHIERTRLLVHMLDGLAEDPIANYQTINAELAAFSSALAQRPQIVAVNKSDVPTVREAWPSIEEALDATGADGPHLISAATGDGVAELLFDVAGRLAEMPDAEPEEKGLPVLRPVDDDEDAFKVYHIKGGGYRVVGTRVERAAAMTDWGNEAAVARFQRILDAIGVTEALRALGLEEGEMVRIGDYELEWQD